MYVSTEKYVDQMRTVTDRAIFNQATGKHSELKKPYLSDDYIEMEYTDDGQTPYDPPDITDWEPHTPAIVKPDLVDPDWPDTPDDPDYPIPPLEPSPPYEPPTADPITTPDDWPPYTPPGEPTPPYYPPEEVEVVKEADIPTGYVSAMECTLSFPATASAGDTITGYGAVTNWIDALDAFTWTVTCADSDVEIVSIRNLSFRYRTVEVRVSLSEEMVSKTITISAKVTSKLTTEYAVASDTVEVEGATAGNVQIFGNFSALYINGVVRLWAVGGTAPYTFSLHDDQSGGAFIGSTTASAEYGVVTFQVGGSAGTDTIRVTDSQGTPTTADYEIAVYDTYQAGVPAGSGGWTRVVTGWDQGGNFSGYTVYHNKITTSNTRIGDWAAIGNATTFADPSACRSEWSHVMPGYSYVLVQVTGVGSGWITTTHNWTTACSTIDVTIWRGVPNTASSQQLAALG